jgi:DNA-binding phage protein
MLEGLRQARQMRDQSEQAFADAVRGAVHDRGELTVREIAEAVGLSRERVYQIAAGKR